MSSKAIKAKKPLTKSYALSLLANNKNLEEIELSPSFYSRSSKKVVKALITSGIKITIRKGVKKHALEKRIKAFKLREKGYSIRQIAKLLRISKSTIHHWLSKKKPGKGKHGKK